MNKGDWSYVDKENFRCTMCGGVKDFMYLRYVKTYEYGCSTTPYAPIGTICSRCEQKLIDITKDYMFEHLHDFD